MARPSSLNDANLSDLLQSRVPRVLIGVVPPGNMEIMDKEPRGILLFAAPIYDGTNIFDYPAPTVARQKFRCQCTEPIVMLDAPHLELAEFQTRPSLYQQGV